MVKSMNFVLLISFCSSTSLVNGGKINTSKSNVTGTLGSNLTIIWRIIPSKKELLDHADVYLLNKKLTSSRFHRVYVVKSGKEIFGNRLSARYDKPHYKLTLSNLQYNDTCCVKLYAVFEQKIGRGYSSATKDVCVSLINARTTPPSTTTPATTIPTTATEEDPDMTIWDRNHTKEITADEVLARTTPPSTTSLQMTIPETTDITSRNPKEEYPLYALFVVVVLPMLVIIVITLLKRKKKKTGLQESHYSTLGECDVTADVTVGYTDLQICRNHNNNNNTNADEDWSQYEVTPSEVNGKQIPYYEIIDMRKNNHEIQSIVNDDLHNS